MTEKFPSASSMAIGMAAGRALLERNRQAKRLESENRANLLDVNPLLYPPLLTNPDHVALLKEITLDHIKAIGGLEPVKFDSIMVQNLRDSSSSKDQRMVVRFEMDRIAEEQIVQLEELAKKTYTMVRTRTTADGKIVPLDSYLTTSINESSDSAKRSVILGWYMGANMTPTDALHQGIFLYRDLGEFTQDTFISGERDDEKFLVEIREAGLTQVNLSLLIIQVSSILGKKEPPDRSSLSSSIYTDLLTPSIKADMVDRAYGTEEIRAQIGRALFLPLGNPQLALELGLEAESVMQIGTWGSGKTTNALSFILENTGTFLVPVKAEKLGEELASDASKQTILPGMERVLSETGMPVVLMVDDIENIAEPDSPGSSAFLNLMAGARKRGLCILASTNQPEKINPALFQPQRFGVIIHTRLQGPEANIHILNLHTPKTYFRSLGERQIILEEIASKVDSFPPRMLAEICRQAKANLLDRVAEIKQSRVGLTTDDLAGLTFIVEDWVKAYHVVSSGFNAITTRKRDEQLSKFVASHVKPPLGFHPAVTEVDGLAKRINERITETGTLPQS